MLINDIHELISLCNGNPRGRIVSTGDLLQCQIDEAAANSRMFVDHDGLGWCFIPWSISTTKDKERERDLLATTPARGTKEGKES